MLIRVKETIVLRELRVVVAILLSVIILLNAFPILLVKADNNFTTSSPYSPNYPQPGSSNPSCKPVSNAPSVSVSPTSVTLDVGQSQVFTSVVSGGTTPYSYQWYLNGVAVSGATSATWTFTPKNAGSYSVYLEVTDHVDAKATSNKATVNVNGAPSVTISPKSVTLDVGQSQVFTSDVDGGTTPYSYQWYLNGVAVSGATSATWAFTPSSAGADSVYVAVTDGVGVKITSNTATVTVNAVPSVTISPKSVSLDVGQSQLFTSSVSGGTSPYSYQWYLNGVAVSGATGASWTFTPSTSGSYTVYVKVKDKTEVQVTSNTALVTVNAALSVTISPSPVVLDVGLSQLFTSSVSGGTGPFSYQWYLDGSMVSGATGATWTYTPTASGSHKVYVKVTDSVGKQATSNTVCVTVHCQLSVTISPTSATLTVGQSQVFTSDVDGGTGPYSYQWYLSGAAVSGATGASWTFTPSTSGSYTVYVKVTDSVDFTATSNTVTVTVNAALSITILPKSVAMDLGQSQVFTSDVDGGTGPYSYKWYLNGVAVSGATSATWTFTPSSTGSYTVYVKVTDKASKQATSNTATVTVNAALSVTILPTSVSLDVGQSQLFTSSVSGGTGPYSYQWYLNGVAVSGATSASWTFSPSSAGSYTVYVVVTDSATSPTNAKSNTVHVSVNPQLAVTIGPLTSTIYLSESQVYTSSISGGTPSYSYQWYLNGSAVSGATSATWAFTPTSTGTYQIYVKVTDGLSEGALSLNAQLIVKSKPSMSATISPSSAVIDLTQSVPFTSSVTGGVSPFSYQWYLNGSAVSGATSATWAFTPISMGHYQVYLNVTDSLGTKAESNVAFITVSSLPSVSISPSPVVMDVGQSQPFTSTVSGGTSPYSYQWYLNGVAVSGATGASWIFTPSSAGSYTIYVKVTDNAGMQATSNTAAVTVNGALSVVVSPSPVVMDVGMSQLFASSVSGGTGPYSYQWYLNGVAVSGATGASWTFTPSASGSYTVYVIVIDSASTPVSATSNTASVTVDPQLEVSVNPSNAAIYLSQSQNFKAQPSGGTLPYTYQWYQNNTLVSGATSRSWNFTPASTGVYLIYVNVTDGVGEVALSPNAQLIVNPEPSILVTISPSSAVIDLTLSVPFTSSVSGGVPSFTYQWYLNGSTVSGATSATWTFTPISLGHYQVYLNITDSLGTKAESNVAFITVSSLPSVSISPSSVVMDVGQSRVFTSTVLGGTSPYAYQWYLNGVAVSGATGASWTYAPASAGNYTVYLTVVDAASVSATSNVVHITVNTAPQVTIAPTPIMMDVGESQPFTSSVSGGTSPYSYQWYLDGIMVLSATGASWTYTPGFAGSHTVYLKVTDAVNATTISNSVPVTVNGPLSVHILPTSVTLDVGQSKLFNSTVSGGTPSFVYQWFLNGVATGTGASWTFVPSSTGSFTIYLNVTDTVGVVAKSNIASVTVNSALSVSILPTAVVLDVGESQTFTATVSGGTSPFSYQWYLNGTAVSRATGSTWTFTQFPSGTYVVYVIVTDSASIDPSVQSNSANVWVNALPTVTISPPSASIILGHSVLFTSIVIGGAPSYSYQWYVNGASAPSATNSIWTFTPTSVGTYYIYLNVTDSTGATAKSSLVQITVAPVPTPGVGGVSTSVNAFSLLAPWLSVISLLAAAMLLKGIIVKKKRK
jgi:hypothetical protein